MYIQIRRRLRLIYTVMAGTILTTVIIIVYFLSENQWRMSNFQTFRNNVYTVTSKLQTENTINNSWMSTMENQHNMVINIEDNGKELIPHGSWIKDSEREYLVGQAKVLSQVDGLDIGVAPVSYAEMKSNYYTIEGNDGVDYSVAVIMIPRDKDYRSVIIFQCFQRPIENRIKQILIYFLIDFFGIIAFYLVSKKLIDRTLYPVEESRKKQTEFIAAASHELKSPLTVIRTSASAIVKIPERSSDYVNNIENECKRLAVLIDDLLILSSTDAKTWTMKKSQIELDMILIDIFDAYEPICKAKGISLDINLQEAVFPKIYGDATRMKQVLVILLDNALEHSQTKEKIVLQAYTKRNDIYIEVVDYGIGIPEEYKQHVFERFYRIDKSRMKKEHYGLGLSIAKELITLHGGSLTLSDTKGGGCTFTIRLRDG